MSCDCHVDPASAGQRRLLLTLLAINATMFLVELVAGFWGQSAGIIADSLDMLADALVYGVSLYAVGKCASIKWRAAWWSGIFQLLLATSIVADVARRAVVGSEPHSTLMMVIASAALVANAYCLSLLSKHRDGEVHMRASWIFSRSDVVANLGVVVAGLLVRLTDSRWPDLVVGAAIALVVISGGFQILREAQKAEPACQPS